MFPSLNLSAFHPTAGQRTSIGSSTNASSMCSLTSGDESMSGTSSRRNTNTANGGVKKPAESRSTSAFLTPFSSTSSLFMQAAAAADNCMSSAQVRRISMPFHKVGNSAAARRLSHIVSSVGDAVNQELMLFGDKPSSQPPFGPDLNREWEIVTVRELCRRLSLEDSFEPSEMPLPEGSQTSQVFDEFMIRQIVDILPPRAEGYPWVKIYSSEKHGFSLATLYRKMSEWTEEMSPVLLVVRDVSGHVFGAVASTALRPNEHYYGTGDSCILFRFTGEFPHTRELRSYTWTGDNQFFINATKDFLSMGAGGGHYGLWLDADLNHGRSQKCATFDNEPLAGGTDEDFVVQFVEAYGFSMS